MHAQGSDDLWRLTVSSVVVVAAVAVILVGPGLVAAQDQGAGDEACLKELNEHVASLDQEPDAEVLEQARKHCEDGDLEAAKGVVDDAGGPRSVAAECQKEVDAYVERYNLKPDRSAIADAKAHCKKGDSRSAIRVIGRVQ